MTNTSESELETMATALERSGRYRVLRQLTRRTFASPPEGTPIRTGMFVDVETTGLDPTRDEIIELAMVPFSYAVDGRIFGIGEAFSSLRQPSKPIPPEVTALTGIDDSMAAGKTIDAAKVTSIVAPIAMVVAHNAGFDRRFLERFSDVFVTKPWACSMTQIPWTDEGFDGVKLSYLAQASGFFYQRHRAVSDCHAAIELLARPLPKSGKLALQELLARARTATWRIWAENSPYDLKDLLKARGYRWNGDANGMPRSWYIDVGDDVLELEIAFLKNEIYQRDAELLVRRIDAHDRFSDRC